MMRNFVLLQHSLCGEMAEEFCFAVQCHHAGQRPAFKRKCSQCITHSSYLAGESHHVPTNGISMQTRPSFYSVLFYLIQAYGYRSMTNN